MGCLFSNAATEERVEDQVNEESVVKQYSWDKRESIRQRDNTVAIVQGLNNETWSRLPGSVSGQQIVIQNCQSSLIYIFDNVTSVLVEDCTECQMYIGPVETSVTFRDCRNCNILTACQQLTAHSCEHLVIFLCCASRPIIDTSKSMKFACFQYFYPQLEDQLHRAQLSVYNNFWSSVYDCSPNNNEPNYEILPEATKVEDYISMMPECCTSIGVCTDRRETIVPYMPSRTVAATDKSCLVMFFNDGLSHDRARTFIRQMREHHPGCSLVQGRELVLKEAEASEIFSSDKYAMAVKQGPIIGLEYTGQDCRHHCQETLVAVSKGSTGLVFISSGQDSAKKQIESFHRFAEAKLGNIKTPEGVKKKS